MVAVKVREEDRTQLQGVDAVAKKPLLNPLSGIHQVELLVQVDHLRRGVSSHRGLGRRGTEYGNRKTHLSLLLFRRLL